MEVPAASGSGQTRRRREWLPLEKRHGGKKKEAVNRPPLVPSGWHTLLRGWRKKKQMTWHVSQPPEAMYLCSSLRVARWRTREKCTTAWREHYLGRELDLKIRMLIRELGVDAMWGLFCLIGDRETDMAANIFCLFREILVRASFSWIMGFYYIRCSGLIDVQTFAYFIFFQYSRIQLAKYQYKFEPICIVSVLL